MATTVIKAFEQFLKDSVNLTSSSTETARTSRKSLIEQIDKIALADNDFPLTYSEKHIQYGSFARNTKIRPLDDIDLMIALSAQGTTYESDFAGAISMHVPSTATTLRALCFDGTSTLNSRKVINSLIKELEQVPLYKKAELKRNQEAAVLTLSYDWHYDIVPCFFTKPEEDGRTFYLIPDGNGNWKKTDPRIDRQRINDVNKEHDGNVLNIIRTVKYWQKRPIMPTMPSYLLETMLLYYYEGQNGTASQFVDMELADVFQYISDNIYSRVEDPKNIQGNINMLSYEEKVKIATVAVAHSKKASEAREYEQNKDHKNSIRLWSEIFGSNFPLYTTV